MLLVLVVGGGFGWIVHRARVQTAAVAAIKRAGGDVYYEWDVTRDNSPTGLTLQANGAPGWPKWLVTRLGPDYFGNVVAVDIINLESTNSQEVPDPDALMTS